MSKIVDSIRRRVPILIAFTLVACGGDGGSSTGIIGTSGSTAVVTAPAPAPTATASPTTTAMTHSVAATSVASPSLAGEDPVASGLDVARYIVPSWSTGAIPGLENPGVEGAFRFICKPSHNGYNDPIVYPGQTGKSHLHTFFGNTKADANSTYRSLRTTGESTCNTLLNRSAYWVPSMMHPSGKVVMPNWIGIYYKRAPEGSKYCREPYAKACLPLPRGLRYIFGYNMTDPSKSDPDRMRWFNCDGAGAVTGHFANIRQAAQGCPTGAMLGMLLVGPNCWNGKELDTPDHRSHMAYQYYDGQRPDAVCPASHPYLLPFFEAAAWYTNDGTAAQWKLSSDVAMNLEGGVSAHADWFGAWEDSIVTQWTENCVNKSLSCNSGDLGNGKQMVMAVGYDFSKASTLVDMPAKP